MKLPRLRSLPPAILEATVLMASLALIAPLAGCSIRRSAINAVADSVAPYPSLKENKPAKTETPEDPMVALTGENDPELVAAFFPTALKLYEMLMLSNPGHEGLALMTGELYVMYAAAFIQGPAERIPAENFDRQNAEYLRAQNLYVRGSSFAVASLDHRFPGFSPAVFGQNADGRATLLSRCKKNDAAALYWASAGELAAFSLSPLDTARLARLPGAVAMLERAESLDPGLNSGAIQEALMAFYASAPEDLGGGRDKALAAYDKALFWSKGQSPSLFVSYAKCFCVPAQDGNGFDAALDRALAIEADSNPDNRLAITLARRQAEWLKSRKSDFILE